MSMQRIARGEPVDAGTYAFRVVVPYETAKDAGPAAERGES